MNTSAPKPHRFRVNKASIRRRIFLMAFLSVTIKIFPQISITAGSTSAQIASILTGGGLIVSNVTITGDTRSYGSFTNGLSSGIGIANGLILSTGDLAELPGNGNVSDDFSTDLQIVSTDPLLQGIVGPGVVMRDHCILEFDVTPQCNKINPVFVFGSDEYTNWIGAGYNDAFGFFVSGPKPGGGNYTNQNIAVLPTTTTASNSVSIDNVNNTSNAN